MRITFHLYDTSLVADGIFVNHNLNEGYTSFQVQRTAEVCIKEAKGKKAIFFEEVW